MAGQNEVEIRVTGRDQSGPAFDSARRGAQRLEQEGGGSADGLSGKLRGLGAAAGAAAATIAIDLAARALGALKNYASGAVSAASNLNESFNAVEKIFKSSAQTIKDWGATQANAYGLSQRAFQEMATPLGALLKNQGIAQDKLAETTINLTKRAADMASVFNTDVPDALDALTAGLRGETDPLERYGVSLDEAKVQAEALAMTGKKTASSLTDTEKATARLKLIFDQTNDVAGDFRSTSDGLANSTRILTARQEELQAQIGQKLLPFMNKLNEIKLAALEYLGNTLFPLIVARLRLVAEGFRPIWEKALPQLRTLLELIKQKWEENRASIEKLTPLLKLLGVVLGVTLVTALVAVAGLVLLFIEYMGRVGDTFGRAKEDVQILVLALLDGFGKILNGAVSAFGWIPGIGPKLKEAQAKFNQFAEEVRRSIEGIPEQRIVDVRVQLSGAEAVGNALSALRARSGISARAHGGVIGAISGAANGGVRNGLVNVGEHGRELALLAPGPAMLPPGSTVIPNGATERALSGGGSSGGVQQVGLVLDDVGDDWLAEILNRLLRQGKLRAFAKA